VSRLDRFKNLERKRGEDDTAPEAARSSRFENIEVRREEPVAPADDPFAPPPVPTLDLEVRADDVLAAKRMHAERDARANAVIPAEAEALLRDKEALVARKAEIERRQYNPIAAMSSRGRAIAFGAGVLSIALMAQLTGVYAWGLLPVLIVMFAVSIVTA
jgi:hypothetical protein